MRLLHLVLASVSLVITPVAIARGPLSEQQAHARAVMILKGEPYGASYTDVGRHIRSATLEQKGSRECGPSTKPAWVFAVHVPKDDLPQHMDKTADIRGHLVIDAVSGKLVCAGLPFLN